MIPGDPVLCRINAPLVETCPQRIQKRIPEQVLGCDIAGKLVVDAKLVFKQGLENWKAKLNRVEAREIEGIKQAKLPQNVTERMVYRCEKELACLRAVIEDAVRGDVTTLKGFEASIDDLFGDARGMVTLSTVHKAKGKEAEKVFPHLMPLPNAETPEEREAENCVRFVAVTRTKQKLVFVEPDGSRAPSGW